MKHITAPVLSRLTCAAWIVLSLTVVTQSSIADEEPSSEQLKSGVQLSNESILQANRIVPTKKKPTVVEAGEQAPQKVEEHRLRFIAGNCGCPIKVDVRWEHFTMPEYKYYSEKTVERALSALNNLCKQDKEEICKRITSVSVDFAESRQSVKLPYLRGPVLAIEAAPQYVPLPNRIEDMLREELDLKKLDDDKSQR